MAKHAPTVMVSSTYYDLKQIRKDLGDFLQKELGYNALLSELDSFPIDPGADTIENCRRRVGEADILILIIGSRYGYVDSKSTKSVTNLEYLTARTKGIPIYAFIDKAVLPLLPVWKNNPKTKFKDIVPDTKIFEFIEQVRSVDGVWMNEFENAQNIIQALRLQFAHLMREGLLNRQRFNSIKDEVPEGISGNALRLILEKPEAWAHYLFAQILTDEINKYTDIREEVRLGISFEVSTRITVSDAIDWWMDNKFEDLSRLIITAATILNKFLRGALGEEDKSSNPKLIVFAAKKLGEVYKGLLLWSQQVRTPRFHKYFQPVIDALASLSNDAIKKIEDFGPQITGELDRVLLFPDAERLIKINLTPEMDTSTFTEALNRVKSDHPDILNY